MSSGFKSTVEQDPRLYLWIGIALDHMKRVMKVAEVAALPRLVVILDELSIYALNLVLLSSSVRLWLS